MKFDRNTVLGFVILAALFFGYFYYTNREQASSRKAKMEKLAKEQAITDSINKLNKPLQDSLSRVQDSVTKKNIVGIFTDTLEKATEELVVVENEVMRITFTTKGGQPKKVELKNFKGPDSNLVRLASTDHD